MENTKTAKQKRLDDYGPASGDAIRLMYLVDPTGNTPLEEIVEMISPKIELPAADREYASMHEASVAYTEAVSEKLRTGNYSITLDNETAERKIIYRSGSLELDDMAVPARPPYNGFQLGFMKFCRFFSKNAFAAQFAAQNEYETKVRRNAEYRASVASQNSKEYEAFAKMVEEKYVGSSALADGDGLNLFVRNHHKYKGLDVNGNILLLGGLLGQSYEKALNGSEAEAVAYKNDLGERIFSGKALTDEEVSKGAGLVKDLMTSNKKGTERTAELQTKKEVLIFKALNGVRDFFANHGRSDDALLNACLYYKTMYGYSVARPERLVFIEEALHPSKELLTQLKATNEMTKAVIAGRNAVTAMKELNEMEKNAESGVYGTTFEDAAAAAVFGRMTEKMLSAKGEPGKNFAIVEKIFADFAPQALLDSVKSTRGFKEMMQLPHDEIVKAASGYNIEAEKTVETILEQVVRKAAGPIAKQGKAPQAHSLGGNAAQALPDEEAVVPHN